LYLIVHPFLLLVQLIFLNLVMPASGLLSAFLGALQASLAVLLTISYGVIAAQFKLLDGQSATSISKICVRMFLPALLITKVGAELHLDTAVRYVPVLGRSSNPLPANVW
jgi:auxin efflux carrier family protein